MFQLQCKPMVAGALCLALCGHAQAVTAWNESVNGDLSSDGLSPTALSVVLGTNSVIGRTGDDGLGLDRDYFSFTVPNGAVLSKLMINPGTQVAGGASFFAVQAGPQVTVDPNAGSAAGLLGYSHYTASDVGTNFLPKIIFSAGNTLPSGRYAFWVQDNSGGIATYNFDFVITAVPEPATAGLFGLGAAAIVWSRRKARRT
jgi:PEP-CTERM motif